MIRPITLCPVAESPLQRYDQTLFAPNGRLSEDKIVKYLRLRRVSPCFVNAIELHFTEGGLCGAVNFHPSSSIAMIQPNTFALCDVAESPLQRFDQTLFTLNGRLSEDEKLRFPARSQTPVWERTCK